MAERALTLSAPLWHAHALCAGHDPDLWHPTDTRHGRADARVAYAAAICARCPVTEQCLEEALSVPAGQDAGVWGGTTPEERQVLRDRRRRRETWETR